MDGKRRLDNWLAGWETFTSPLPSPELWRRWTGIFTLAAVLERKVWLRTNMGELFPNLYVIICGPPGLGKSILTSQVWKFLNHLSDGTDKGFHLASSSVTFASIIDELADAKRQVVRLDLEPNLYDFNALTIVSNELGVLLPEYDKIMMPKLTDLWDGHHYSESRRTKEKKEKIEFPQLNLIAGCTPAYLTATLPEGAWDQGFLSRTLIAFSTESIYKDLFSIQEFDTGLQQKLLLDLRVIFNSDFTFGPMVFEASAQDAFSNWAKKGGPPVPEHPKLMHYNTRRVANLLKLCMIASIAESNARIITNQHLSDALDWLTELEVFLGDIFKAMVVGGDRQAMQECWYHFATKWTQKNELASEEQLINFLSTRLPAYSVIRTLEIMVKAGLFREVFDNGHRKMYEPLRPKND